MAVEQVSASAMELPAKRGNVFEASRVLFLTLSPERDRVVVGKSTCFWYARQGSAKNAASLCEIAETFRFPMSKNFAISGFL